MRARLSEQHLAQRLGRDLSPLAVLACAAILFLADWGFWQSGGSVFPGGPLDETAHFITALLLLQALPPKWRTRIIVPALIGSVAIDVDHIPQYLGHYFLLAGTERPATHSLLTPLVLLVLALAVRRHRYVFMGLALGILLHFFRDMAEGNGTGVPLLWPLTNRAFTYSHATYLVFMACVVAADLCVGLINQRTRVATQ